MHVPPRGRPEPCYLTYPGAPTAGLHIGLPAERCSTSLFPVLKGKGCCPTAATGGNKALSHADRSFQSAVCRKAGSDSGETKRWRRL